MWAMTKLHFSQSESLKLVAAEVTGFLLAHLRAGLMQDAREYVNATDLERNSKFLLISALTAFSEADIDRCSSLWDFSPSEYSEISDIF